MYYDLYGDVGVDCGGHAEVFCLELIHINGKARWRF